MRSVQRGISATFLVLAILVITIASAAGYFVFSQNLAEKIKSINSFEDCAKKYPVMESYPEQCNTPDGKHFTRELTAEEKRRLVPPLEPSSEFDEVASWKTYKNSKFNYSISYPNSWYIRSGEDPYGGKAKAESINTLDYVLLTLNPPCENCGGYPSGVYVLAEENNTESISTYADNLLINYKDQKDNLQKEVINIDGKEIIVIKGIIPSKKIAVLKNGKVFITINFDQIEGINENELSSKILKTFKFLE